MTEFSKELGDRFTMTAGKRGRLSIWIVVFALAWLGFVYALVTAFGRHGSADPGGVGHVFIPAAGIAFVGLGLCLLAARWWEDETAFRVVDGRVEVRHGVGPFHWPAVRFSPGEAFVITTTGAEATARVFLEQGSKRVLLGSVGAIMPQQYPAWEQWMTHHGLVVER